MIRILENLNTLNEANTSLSRLVFQNGVRLPTTKMRNFLYDRLFIGLKDIISTTEFIEFLQDNNLQIHHINGTKSDNELFNLLLITNSMHQRLEDACEKYTHEKYAQYFEKIKKIDISQEQKDKIYAQMKLRNFPKRFGDEKINDLVSMKKEPYLKKVYSKGFTEYASKYKNMSDCKKDLEQLQNPNLEDIIKVLLNNSIFTL